LRTSKDSSVGEFDESIISVFNIIFESDLFIFDFVLFKIISFLELFYFNCKLFNFENKYFKDSVLEQKKEGLELIRVENTKIQYINIFPQLRSLAPPVPPATQPCQLLGYSFVVSASRTSYLLVYF